MLIVVTYVNFEVYVNITTWYQGFVFLVIVWASRDGCTWFILFCLSCLFKFRWWWWWWGGGGGPQSHSCQILCHFDRHIYLLTCNNFLCPVGQAVLSTILSFQDFYVLQRLQFPEVNGHFCAYL